ncbi:RNA-guided endonuclease TnpB family protein [Streptomyces sp. NPDC046712]|uniref:RNA-guided endonuclease InsQ/TnpB family protein n=1 Tax=Streptomyces sp. NPDC046712 TaxID=3154802 RepID=UPI0033C6E1EB
MRLRYSFRLYPNGPQRSALARAFGCARVVYNDALRARETARASGGAFMKTGDLSKLLITEAKKTEERAWLGEVSAVVLQQSLRDLDTAYRNFFDGLKGKRPRMGSPRFKSRKDNRQAVRFTANARWKITTGGDLSLPKIGNVRVKWSRALPSTPSAVTVVKDAADRYFASFVVETEPETLPETDAVVGVDLGLSHFAILSDGTKIDSPRFLRRAEKKLKKAQRHLSRKAKGGKPDQGPNQGRPHPRRGGRRSARVPPPALNEDHRENQAVAVEDLAVKGLARTRMAKSVHDAGWSAFVAMLEYKAARYGRSFHRVGRFEPTSQVC